MIKPNLILTGHNLLETIFTNTVQPECNDHYWELKIVATPKLLFNGHFEYKKFNINTTKIK